MKKLLLLSLLLSTTIACSNEEAKLTPKTKDFSMQDMQMPQRPDFESMLPEVVAIVDGKEITRAEVIKYVDALSSANPQFAFGVVPRLTTKEAVRDMIVNSMINDEIVAKAAIEAGYPQTKETAQKFLDKEISAIPADKLAEIKDGMEKQGKKFDDYVKELLEDPTTLKNASIQLWISEKIVPTIELTDTELLETTANMAPNALMQMASDSCKAEAKAKLEKIASDIKAGGDFAAAAKENSACPSGKSGGSLGEFGKGRMDPAFEKAAFALKQKGDVSDVFESSFGFHIIQLDADPTADKVNASHILVVPTPKTTGDILVTEEMKNAAKQRKVVDSIEKITEEARKTMKIEMKI